MRLYEITNDIRGLMALADDGELSLESIEDTLSGLEVEFTKKAEAVIKVRQQMLANVASIDNEISRLVALKKSPAANAERLEEYLRESLIALDKDKIDLGIFKVTVKKATDVLGELDEDKIPGEYWQEVPASKKLDKRALLAEAKVSEIPGVTLTKSKRALIIK